MLFLQLPTPSSLKQCLQLHAHMIVSGTTHHPPAFEHLVKSLLNPTYGHLSYTLTAFLYIPNTPTRLSNSIIRAFSENHAPKESLYIYFQMRRKGFLPDSYTFQFLFKAASKLAFPPTGQPLHADSIKQIPESEISVNNSLIHMYTEFGQVDIARRVFDKMGPRNVVSWTTIVGAYAKVGLMEEARRLFEEMPERNVVSWTSMIAGFAQKGQPEEAIGFFKRMVSVGVKPDVVALVSVLSACAQWKDRNVGFWVQQFVDRGQVPLSNNLVVALIDMYTKCGDVNAARRVFDGRDHNVVPAWNALIDGYCKAGDLMNARSLFDRMDCRDLITFNSMITGYIHSRYFNEALLLFANMQASGLKPDQFTIVGLLTACANLGALDQGKLLHAYTKVNFIKRDIILGTALVDMYAKCGRIDQANMVFHRMQEKDMLTWTALISGLSMHGHGRSAIAHFVLMQKEGIRPNRVTYVALLSACSHAGLVQEGLFHFKEMQSMYNIEPEIEHYGCMVDLLGRVGHLKEAELLIENMPVEPNAVIWGSLLGACRVHNDVKLAEKAAKCLLVMEPNIDATFVLLYNVYASLGRWADAAKIRRMMEEQGIRKTSGCSSIVVDGSLHEFVAGDRAHPQFGEIQLMITEISKGLKMDRSSMYSLVTERR